MDVDESEEPVRDETEDEVRWQQEKDPICSVETDLGSNTVLSEAGVSGRPSLNVSGSADVSPINEVSMAESHHHVANSNEGPSSYPTVDMLDESMVEGDQLEESHEIHASASKADAVIPKAATPAVLEVAMVSCYEEVASTTIVIDSNKSAIDSNSTSLKLEKPAVEVKVERVHPSLESNTIKDLGDSSLLKPLKNAPETLASDKEDNDLEDLDEEEGGIPNPTASTGNVADLAPVKKKRAKRRFVATHIQYTISKM